MIVLPRPLALVPHFVHLYALNEPTAPSCSAQSWVRASFGKIPCCADFILQLTRKALESTVCRARRGRSCAPALLERGKARQFGGVRRSLTSMTRLVDALHQSARVEHTPIEARHPFGHAKACTQEKLQCGQVRLGRVQMDLVHTRADRHPLDVRQKRAANTPTSLVFVDRYRAHVRTALRQGVNDDEAEPHLASRRHPGVPMLDEPSRGRRWMRIVFAECVRRQLHDERVVVAPARANPK